MRMTATVVDLIHQIERTYPGRVGVEDLSGRQLTVAEIRRRSNRVAHGLIAAGLKPGDGVMYLGRNHLEYVEIDFGIAKAGLTRIPLYHQLSERDLTRAVELTGARVLIADEEAAKKGRLDKLLDAFSLRVVLGSAPGWLSYADWLAEGSEDDVWVRVDAEQPYHVRMTSGSSGLPKGIVVSHRAARHAMLGNHFVLNREAFEARPRTLQQAPVTLASGWTIVPTLLSGGTNILAGKFDPERSVATMVETGATWSFMVPTMLRMITQAGAAGALRRSRISALAYGGEPAPVDAMESLLEQTDALVNVYGQTETPSWTLVLGREDHRNRELWGSAGRAIPGIEAGVLLEDGVVAFEEGATGSLVLRGGNVCSAILGDEKGYRERLLPDGWWRTGDTATLEADGIVRLVGRESEIIIRGGSNVHPSEIEAVLGKHPAVREVAVVGMPDPVWGEVPVALVSADKTDEAAREDLESWAREHLTGPKRPERIVLTAKALPRADADSKVSKVLTKAQLAELLGAARGSGAER